MADLGAKEWLRDVNNIIPYLPKHVAPRVLLQMGGQGAVYTGSVDGKEAAIKVYYPGQMQVRIDREVEALRRLECPTIVRLLWADRVAVENETYSVVATDLVSGTPLNQVLKRGPLSERLVAVLVRDVAQAIDAMWQCRIVHRDLKPSNIMVLPTGHACVIDLGVARHLDETSLTQLGVSWGTWGYLSPEQGRGAHQLTCRSDVYALGIVALEAGLGRHPTRGDQHQLWVMRYHEELPSQLRSWAWASLLLAMLHRRATMRPLPMDIVSTLADYLEEA